MRSTVIYWSKHLFLVLLLLIIITPNSVLANELKTYEPQPTEEESPQNLAEKNTKMLEALTPKMDLAKAYAETDTSILDTILAKVIIWGVRILLFSSFLYFVTDYVFTYFPAIRPFMLSLPLQFISDECLQINGAQMRSGNNQGGFGGSSMSQPSMTPVGGTENKTLNKATFLLTSKLKGGILALVLLALTFFGPGMSLLAKALSWVMGLTV